ncbi:hypothetical protein GC163_06425 [bacterium]|nr:hypothetical protein [bacterium]
MRRCATTLEAEMTPAEHQLLLETLQQAPTDGLRLEIGTAAGGTLCAMLDALPVEQRRFVVVDPMKYFPQQLDTVCKNLRDHDLDPGTVDFRVSTSDVAFEDASARQEAYSFMLIDGCHKIRSVTIDLKWTRLLAVGGVVCFHDVVPELRGVWLAVQRFVSRHPNYELIAQADSLLALRKTAESATPEIDTSDEWYARMWYLPLQVERKWKKLHKAA